MEFDASLSSVIIIAAIVVGVVLLLAGIFVLFAYRTPPEYGPDEMARVPGNPTATTIARDDMISIRFFENQALVAKAKFWGLRDKGIALILTDDPTEYLLTSDGDWFEETRFRVKPDIRMILLAGGKEMISAQRLPDSMSGWRKGKDGKYTRVYIIDCAQDQFELVRLKRGKFSLRQGGSVLGIAAMPMSTGIFGRLKSRIELPASLPLAIRLFLAMVVYVEDTEGFSSDLP
jgi:hypothetical protein